MRLVPYAAGDLDLTAALESDPDVMMELGGPVPPDQIRLIHDKRLAASASGDWFFTIVADDTSGAVGIAGIWQTPWDGGAISELGVMLLPAYRRQRLGLRAAEMMIEMARAEGLFPQIHTFVAVANHPANAGCRDLGFSLLGQCDMDYEGRPLRCNHWLLDPSG